MIDNVYDHNNLIEDDGYIIEIMGIANNEQVDIATSKSNLTFRFPMLNFPCLNPGSVSSGLPNLSSLLSSVPGVDPIIVPGSVPTLVPGSPPSLDPSYLPSIVPTLVPSSIPIVPSFTPHYVPHSVLCPIPSYLPNNFPCLVHSSVPSFDPSTVPGSVPHLAAS